METLYAITGEYLALLEMADEADEQTFIDTLESINGELETKADNYGIVINELSAKVNQIEAEVKRLTERKSIIENNVKRMKERLKGAMEVLEKDTIQTEHYKFKICKNGGKQPIEIVGEVPDNFKRVILEDDKDKIRKALEDGEELEFAVLKDRGTHIRIS